MRELEITNGFDCIFGGMTYIETAEGIEIKTRDISFKTLEWVIPRIHSKLYYDKVVIYNDTVNKLRSIVVELNDIDVEEITGEHKLKSVRPCYEIVGDRVMSTQADEIISRTSSQFNINAYNSEDADSKDYMEFNDNCHIGYMNFRVDCNYGDTWVNRLGSIYKHGCTNNNPTLRGIVLEWLIMAYHFPFLNMNIFISDIERYELASMINWGNNENCEWRDWNENRKRFIDSLTFSIALRKNKIVISGIYGSHLLYDACEERYDMSSLKNVMQEPFGESFVKTVLANKKW